MCVLFRCLRFKIFLCCLNCTGLRPGDCCDTCEAVRAAYAAKGWSFNTEGIAQCQVVLLCRTPFPSSILVGPQFLGSCGIHLDSRAQKRCAHDNTFLGCVDHTRASARPRASRRRTAATRAAASKGTSTSPPSTATFTSHRVAAWRTGRATP